MSPCFRSRESSMAEQGDIERVEGAVCRWISVLCLESRFVVEIQMAFF